MKAKIRLRSFCVERPESALRMIAVILTISVFSCAPLFSGLPADPDSLLIMPVSGTGDFKYELEVSGIPRDVYFVFSASADKDNYAVPSLQPLFVDGSELPAPTAMKLPVIFGESSNRGQWIADFNRDPWAALGVARPAAGAKSAAVTAGTLPAAPLAYTVGEAATLRDDVSTWSSTCRYVSADIAVGVDGTPRRLVVWVENASWTAGGTKTYLVTQAMVDWLAGKFLAAGADNDVFDWLTAILGAEWAGTPYANLIGFTGDIHIVLADIGGDDEPDGGMVGYFWSLNNFKNSYLAGTPYAGLSNERVMFVLDSVMFANPLGGGNDAVWSSSDYWAQELYSTLAHEFQHMISFYQRGVLRNSEGADVWIEELCSLLAEDLLAERMGIPGPRGVDPADGTAGPYGNGEGRMPLFNRYSYLPLAVTSGFDLYDYSTAYAFGAWLARNYGGAGLLRRLVHSAAGDEALIEDAAAAGGAQAPELDSLLARWGASVLCSDREDLPAGYRYNAGTWFTSTLDGHTYRLGSLDAFRYSYGALVGPYVFTAGGPVGQGRASSNVFFRAATGFTGKRSFDIVLPEGVSMYAVLK